MPDITINIPVTYNTDTQPEEKFKKYITTAIALFIKLFSSSAPLLMFLESTEGEGVEFAISAMLINAILNYYSAAESLDGITEIYHDKKISNAKRALKLSAGFFVAAISSLPQAVITYGLAKENNVDDERAILEAGAVFLGNFALNGFGLQKFLDIIFGYELCLQSADSAVSLKPKKIYIGLSENGHLTYSCIGLDEKEYKNFPLTDYDGAIPAILTEETLNTLDKKQILAIISKAGHIPASDFFTLANVFKLTGGLLTSLCVLTYTAYSDACLQKLFGFPKTASTPIAMTTMFLHQVLAANCGYQLANGFIKAGTSFCNFKYESGNVGEPANSTDYANYLKYGIAFLTAIFIGCLSGFTAGKIAENVETSPSVLRYVFYLFAGAAAPLVNTTTVIANCYYAGLCLLKPTKNVMSFIAKKCGRQSSEQNLQQPLLR